MNGRGLHAGAEVEPEDHVAVAVVGAEVRLGGYVSDAASLPGVAMAIIRSINVNAAFPQ